MQVYLIVTRRSIVRLTHKAPSLRAGEFPIRLTLNIDPQFFQNPYPHIQMDVGAEDYGQEIQVVNHGQAR